MVKRFLPLVLAMFAIGSFITAFFIRAPVLLITDASFNSIYGAWRMKKKQAEVSLSLFRPFRLVTVSEGASPDLIAISVKAASSAPYVVFFPYRYEQGALQYSEANSGIPVAVLGGRARINQKKPELILVRTDYAADLYFAGAAAYLIAEGRQGNILFFYDGTMNNADREAVSSGVKDAGGSRNPLFVSAGSNYSQWDNAACVITNGSATDYFEKSQKVPSVLFSWIDTAMTPHKVKVLIDDSPPAVIVRAVKGLKNGEREFFLKSEYTLFPERFEDKAPAEKIKKLMDNPGLYKKTEPAEAENQK
ncbi:MAG: hypothetical protein LBH43_05525 [Treponema sp.]|nr:hypothetical protein [Treponema sp.]